MLAKPAGHRNFATLTRTTLDQPMVAYAGGIKVNRVDGVDGQCTYTINAASGTYQPMAALLPDVAEHFAAALQGLPKPGYDVAGIFVPGDEFNC
jgi:hypothetical protein